MRGISMRENREARRSPVGVDDAPPGWVAGWQVGVRAGREGKAIGRKPEMNDRWESNSCVVPAKLANKAGVPAAELVEGRRLDEGNTGQQNALRTQGREGRASSALDRVRRVAMKDGDARFTALLHHVSVDRLPVSPTAAAGADEVTWQDYGNDLEENLLVCYSAIGCPVSQHGGCTVCVQACLRRLQFAAACCNDDPPDLQPVSVRCHWLQLVERDF
jgi:hypothetical protein